MLANLVSSSSSVYLKCIKRLDGRRSALQTSPWNSFSWQDLKIEPDLLATNAIYTTFFDCILHRLYSPSTMFAVDHILNCIFGYIRSLSSKKNSSCSASVFQKTPFLFYVFLFYVFLLLFCCLPISWREIREEHTFWKIEVNAQMT